MSDRDDRLYCWPDPSDLAHLELAWRSCHERSCEWALRIATIIAGGGTPTPDDIDEFRVAQEEARIALISWGRGSP